MKEDNIPILIEENNNSSFFEKIKNFFKPTEKFKRKLPKLNLRIDINEKSIRKSDINIDVIEYLIPTNIIFGILTLISMIIALFSGMNHVMVLITFILCIITLIIHFFSWYYKKEKVFHIFLWLFNVGIWLFNLLS